MRTYPLGRIFVLALAGAVAAAAGRRGGCGIGGAHRGSCALGSVVGRGADTRRGEGRRVLVRRRRRHAAGKRVDRGEGGHPRLRREELPDARVRDLLEGRGRHRVARRRSGLGAREQSGHLHRARRQAGRDRRKGRHGMGEGGRTASGAASPISGTMTRRRRREEGGDMNGRREVLDKRGARVPRRGRAGDARGRCRHRGGR